MQIQPGGGTSGPQVEVQVDVPASTGVGVVVT